jgi:leucyl-tRNA synthetase
MSPPTPPWEPSAIEARRQAVWHAHEAFRTPEADGRAGLYIKPSAPFTSGNIHIGHVRSYAIGDAYARFQRARGEAVLFAFGFDAFGLPAELGAIAGGVSPNEWVERCANHMQGQLERLGFSFDWERAFMSSDANMYRWSQWLFLTLLEHDLIYRGTGAVDWCDTCQTTLATIQVEEGGTCWRCHNPVRLIQRPEWYLRISRYVEENDRRLDGLRNWDETSLASQRFVLGRVDGVELDLAASDEDLEAADEGLAPRGAGTERHTRTLSQARMLTVFTPHADALADARFVLMSPKHPQVEEWASDPQVQEQLEELRSGGGERAARDAQAIALVDTGRAVVWPGGAGTLPVLISPVVDGRFGATAVLGVPDKDGADATVAERLWGPASGGQERAVTDPAGSARSGPAEAIEAAGSGSALIPSAAAPSPPLPPARPAKRFKAGDFAVSRQRSWGTPIPIVYCESCGAVPVPKEQLPVVLPLDLKPTGEGNPLAERDDFVNVACPECGGAGRRETDTLDCHFDALWLWVPACVPPAAREGTLEDILALEDLRRWLPSGRLVAGTDSGNFVFDQRMVSKALRDIGPLAFLADGEPFAGCLFHEMVIRDGRKMSKHLGNVVDPDELLERYGADTLRLAVLYAARPQKSLNWSDSAVAHCHRFLKGLWTYTQAQAAQDPEPLDEKGAYETEHLRARMEKWLDTAVEKVSEDMRELEMHKAVRNTMRLLDRIRDYEAKVRERTGGELGGQNHEVLMRALAALAQMLIPFAPHAGEELWLACAGGEDGAAVEPAWPLGRTETVTSAPGAGV